MRKQGFTIVELLIVIVVIAILAAVTIVAYNGIQDRAKNAAAQSAVSQASKKLMAYAALNSDQYPTSLSQADIQNSDNSLQYTGGGASYCVTATSQNVSYFQTNTQSATKGSCNGHGKDGIAAITNYFINPKPNSTNLTTVWDGGNTGTTNNNVAASWSESGRANRIVFPSTITASHGGPTINIGTPYLSSAGQKFTIAFSIRLVAGSANIAAMSIDRNSSSVGSLTIHATGGTVGSMVTGQTYRVYATFTADSAAAETSNNLRFYVNIGNKSSSATIEFADLDMYPGDYQSTRKWASGDSSGWVWNGGVNNSTSTGAPL